MAGTDLHVRSAPAPGLDDGPVRLRHQAPLDGLRGLAVAAVIAFHAELLDGGFLGVDLFFVLSGFLITSLLLVERRSRDRISLARFWGRRARRLLPALLVVLAAVAVYAAVAAEAVELRRIRGDGFATLLYVANWHDLIADHSYWELFAAPSPLAHAWSLAIEEQLYLVWPLVVVLLASRARRPAERVLAASLVGAVASSVWMLVLYARELDAHRAYLGTDTRVAAILIGAAVAAFLEVVHPGGRDVDAPPELVDPDPPTDDGEPVEHPLALAGLAAAGVVGWLWWSADGAAPMLYQGGFALHSIASAVLVVTVVHPRPTVLHRVLSLPPLVWLGRVSYGLYLWHWPVFVWLDESRTGREGLTLLAVRLGVSVVLAAASYRFVERPVRSGRVPARSLLVGIPVATVVVAIGLFAATVGADDAATSPQLVSEGATDPLANSPTVMLAGDSLALNVASGIQALRFEQRVTVRTAGEPQCSIFEPDELELAEAGRTIGGCGTYDDVGAKVAAVRANVDVDVVVVLYGIPDVDDVRDDEGIRRTVCDPEGAAVWSASVAELLDGLEPAVPAVLVSTPPLDDGAAAEQVPRDHAMSLDELNRRYGCFAELLSDIAADRSGVSYLDLAGWLCDEGCQRETQSGATMRPDGLHFGDDSSLNVARWLLAELRGLRLLERSA